MAMVQNRKTTKRQSNGREDGEGKNKREASKGETYLAGSITKLKLTRFVVDRDDHCKRERRKKRYVN